MDKFYMITNRAKDTDFLVSHEIKEYLESHGKTCFVNPMEVQKNGRYRYTDASRIPEDIEAILVLGGDGTLIQAARDLIERQLPLIGINFGTLGYLAEVEKQSIIPALDRLMKDEYTVENRMMLEGSIQRKDGTCLKDVALNDIVISRSGALRVIDFKIYVNDEFLNLYSADGIIIATPTGSTAYNMSAGGPIVSPEAELIVVTPICPHTLNTRSIVLSAADKVTIEVCEDRNGVAKERLVSYDGDNSQTVVSGDIITVQKAQQRMKILRLNKISFLEILRNKFN